MKSFTKKPVAFFKWKKFKIFKQFLEQLEGDWNEVGLKAKLNLYSPEFTLLKPLTSSGNLPDFRRSKNVTLWKYRL